MLWTQTNAVSFSCLPTLEFASTAWCSCQLTYQYNDGPIANSLDDLLIRTPPLPPRVRHQSLFNLPLRRLSLDHRSATKSCSCLCSISHCVLHGRVPTRFSGISMCIVLFEYDLLIHVSMAWSRVFRPKSGDKHVHPSTCTAILFQCKSRFINARYRNCPFACF